MAGTTVPGHRVIFNRLGTLYDTWKGDDVAVGTGGTGGGTGGGGTGGGGGGFFTLRNISMPVQPGLSNPGALTSQAGVSHSSGTVTYTNKLFTSYCYISGTANVTFNNCAWRFSGIFVQVQMQGGTAAFNNCEFTPNQTEDMFGILQTGGTVTVTSCYFGNIGNGMRFENGLVQYCFFNQHPTIAGSHADCIEVYNQTGPLRIANNVFDLRDAVGQTANINCVPYSDTSYVGRVDGAIFEGNSFIGGSFPLYVQRQGTRSVCKNVIVRNNQWISQWNGDAGSYVGFGGVDYSKSGLYGRAALTTASDTNADSVVSNYVTTWTGNTFDGVTLAKADLP